MSTTTNPPTPRSVWIALILMAAVIVGAGAGLLAYAGGANVPMAVLTGGGAFAGTVLLLLALLSFASGKPA
jgi:heme A synthase